MKSFVDSKHHDLLADANDKMLLYLAHRCRVKNQRHRINEVMEHLLEHEAMVVMNFKMKFESMYFQEKQLNFMGRKACHGMGA
mmetsp:Transcript_50118/g.60492  ORF Transcript_50118/g.60492 Transcript_50118/m.60492 type:complete len:83 (-) Transcript_50118:1852-2100(-)